jgi:hypothetical protein
VVAETLSGSPTSPSGVARRRPIPTVWFDDRVVRVDQLAANAHLATRTATSLPWPGSACAGGATACRGG